MGNGAGRSGNARPVDCPARCGQRPGRGGEAAVSTVSRFFEQVDQLAYQPTLHKVRGTIRFEIRDGADLDHWLLTIEDGRVRVAHGWYEAQAVVRADLPLAEEMTRGRVNALAAMLRGDILVEGDLALTLKLGRLFPASPQTRGPVHRTRPATVR
jgi:putative sterol carrier protein